MKWVKRLAILAALVIVGFLGLQYAASETTGEVVVLTTTDADGNSHETRLWIVDNGGEAWLRAGMNKSSWYGRILENPSVTLMRNGSAAQYTAVPVPAATDTISGLVRQKYGWGDKLISKMMDRKASVAIRLEPAS